MSAEVYEQECEFYRHQDNLMWGRFQTAATVKGALVGALFLESARLKNFEPCLALAALVLVIALFLVPLKDGSDAQRHLDRIKEFESASPLRDSPWPKRSGYALMIAGFAVLILINAFLWLRYL